jgi:hypothetical protein
VNIYELDQIIETLRNQDPPDTEMVEFYLKKRVELVADIREEVKNVLEKIAGRK